MEPYLPPSPSLSRRFHEAIRRFDQANRQDPNQEWSESEFHPREWIFAIRLYNWVLLLQPNASEPLLLAARCQHLRRWEIPRSAYPPNRAGYLQWRNRLKQFHADLSSAILSEVGYSDEIIRRVRELNLKIGFPADPETRVLEDALCLVFLQFQLEEFASRTEEEKVVNALRKSWAKMTPGAREHALGLTYGPKGKRLLSLARDSQT